MNKYIYTVGTIALALLMSGLPVAAFAERDGIEDDGSVQARAPIQTAGAHTSVTARSKGLEDEDENEFEARGEDSFDDELPARSPGELHQKIEDRKHQLEQEAASTTSAHRDIVEQTNPVRLAAHSFLIAKDLLGGMGPRVSEIARQMNDSVATTTDAEAKIQSRGFFAHLFFGGDRASANIIEEEVAQNQRHIDDLIKLLGEANVSADIQTTLTAQIAALQDAQTRLQAFAEKEQKAWGLFSWRF